MPDALTVAQAAFVLDEPLDAFKKAVERGPVRAELVRRGKTRTRLLRLGDLVFLYADRELRHDLTPKGRADLYEALVKLPRRGSKREIALGELKLDYGRYLTAVEARIAELDTLLNEIDGSERNAFIKGTRIEPHRIAALLADMTVAEILRDYPSLTERQVAAAKAYAEAHPKPGRPFPSVTAKAAMRRVDLGDLDAFMNDAE